MAARNGVWSSTCRTTSHSLASNSHSGILSICGEASPEGHSDDKPTLDELFEDGRAIERALPEAARDARRLHKALGHPRGDMERRPSRRIQPEDIIVDDDSEPHPNPTECHAH
jgi:hypothetical protein